MATLDIRLPVKKADAVKGLVTGWAALSRDAKGNPVVDHHGEYIAIDQLERAVHKALLTNRTKGGLGEMHEVSGVGSIVESFVVTREKMAALGYPGDGAEGWVVTVKINDPKVLQRVVDGELQELSIRGSAKRVPIGGADV